MNKTREFVVIFSRRIHQRSICSESVQLITSPVPSQDNIARLILEQKSADEALRTFKWASNLPNFTHSQSTHRALIHKLCIFRRFDIAHQMLDEMLSSSFAPPDESIFVTIVRGLGRAGMIKEVIKVVELVSKFDMKPSLKLLNSILDVLVKVDIDIAREFYRRKMMGRGVEGDDYTYGILMKGLCATNRIGDGFKLLQVLKTRGMKPNIVMYNTLMHALCRNGKVGTARSLMREMEEPSKVTFNILISSYCKEDDLVQALVMLEKAFNKGFVPDAITVTKVVDILCRKGRVSEAVEVLGRVEGRGGEIDVVAYNTLIKGYCKSGKARSARRFLKEMEIKGYLPNADTYNALISGLCESRMLDMALEMFDEMQRVGLKRTFETYNAMIFGFCSNGRTQEGLEILALMEENQESKGHIAPCNWIIYGLYRENQLDEAFEFLNTMKDTFPRAVDRSQRILGFCKGLQVDEAMQVYAQMINEGCIPNAVVYANLIHLCCQKERVREAIELTNGMLARGYSPVALTFNGLIRALCRRGKIENALKLLEDLVGRGCGPDIESYGSILEAFCCRGELHKAVIVFLQMVEKGIVPNYSSWSCLLECLFHENNSWCGVGDQILNIIRT